MLPFGEIFIQITFWAMTACAIGGALGVVLSDNLFHAALSLVVSLFGVAGYYVLLSAGFLAVVQLLVYIGAISILILFGIMFSRRVMSPGQDATNQQWLLSVIAAAALFGVLLVVLNAISWPVTTEAPTADSVTQLGLAFLGSYLIPFMVVSVFLSLALIGAIFLAREKLEIEELD